MKTFQLTGTDIAVSQLIFGCWGITSDFHWGTRDEEESVAAIHAALDAGVNFFDTAEMYGDGNSETLLGKALSGKRDQVVIATKMRPDSMKPEQIAALGGCLVDFHSAAIGRDAAAHNQRVADRLAALDAASFQS